MLASTVLALVLSQELPAAAPPPTPVLRLEGRKGGFGTSDEVEISFYLHAGQQGTSAWRVHVRRDYRGPPGQVDELDRWIEGRDCPAVAASAESLRRFDPPRAYGPDEQGQATAMAPHGTRYVLTSIGAVDGGEAATVTTDLSGLILGETVTTTLNQLRACKAAD
jgi:hypothetical protein